MPAVRHAEAIASLLAARRGGPLLTPDYELESLDDVYAIQSGVMAELGAVGGWKVGRAGADQPLIFAPIRADLMRPAPDTRRPAEARLRGLELEIAFRIDGPLPAADAPDFMARLAAIVTPLPAFEVVDSRLHDPQATSAHWRLADFQLNAGLIYGAPLTGSWTPEDFAQPTVHLTVDGEDAVSGPATLNTGTPFGMLADLVRQCRDHCGGVQPGQIVTTGSFTGLRFFPAGTRLTGLIAGMQPLTMTFAI